MGENLTPGERRKLRAWERSPAYYHWNQMARLLDEVKTLARESGCHMQMGHFYGSRAHTTTDFVPAFPHALTIIDDFSLLRKTRLVLPFDVVSGRGGKVELAGF